MMHHRPVQPDTDMVRTLVDTMNNDNENVQKITDLLPHIIYLYHVDTRRFTFLNMNKVSEILGYAKPDLLAMENDLIKFTEPADLERVQQVFASLSDADPSEKTVFHFSLLHKNGIAIPFKMEGSVIQKDDDQHPLQVLFVAYEYQEKEATLSAAYQSAMHYRDTDADLGMGKWWIREKDGVMHWSKSLYTLLGINTENLDEPGQFARFISFLHTPDAQRFQEEVKQAFRLNKSLDGQFEFRLPQGTSKNMMIRGTINPGDAGGKTLMGICVAMPAINNPSQDEKMVMENERLLGYGTWIYDFRTEEISWSDGMYILFGYDPGQDRGRLNVDEDIYFKHMDSHQVKTMMEKRKKFLEQGISEYTWEYEIRVKGINEIKRVESYSRLVTDVNNTPIQIIGTSRDITRLREYERSLELKVKELDRSNRELEEFAYVASHDLQEPLRKLTTFSERLQTKFADKLDSDANAYINRMLAATENMRLLIDKLLEYSRTARSNDLYVETDMNSLVKKSMADLELIIEETGTQIIINDLPSLPVIPTQISQLFANLVGNAIKFRQKEQVPVIKIDSRPLAFTEKNDLQLDRYTNYFQIDITDNGIGFEAEYAEKIFQIFQRLHSKAEFPGSGIGLSICKKIVENHNGHIYAKSEPMQGATFSIILPGNH